MKRAVIALATALLAAAPASAAVLTQAEGDVLVNTGNGFAKATPGQQLRTGDRVMIGVRGGKATVSYDPACAEQVERGVVVTVKQLAPCDAADSGDGLKDGRGSSKDDRIAGGAGGTPGGAGLPNGLMIAGGAAIVVGAGVLIYNATKPSSP